MNKQQWIKKAIVIGMVTTMGLGTMMATGVGATKVEAATVSKGQSVVNFGKNFMGTPYKFGASTSTTKVFDCSSFMKHIFNKYNVSLPRTGCGSIKSRNCCIQS